MSENAHVKGHYPTHMVIYEEKKGLKKLLLIESLYIFKFKSCFTKINYLKCDVMVTVLCFYHFLGGKC